MSFKDIKKVVKNLGHAILLEEDGSGFVVLPLERYLELGGNGVEEEILVKRAETMQNGYVPEVREASSEQELSLIEKLNQDIALLKEEIKKRELEELESGLERSSVD